LTGVGRLAVVGCGIQLGRHIGTRALSEIRYAEVVMGLADAFALDWLKALRPDFISLAGLYGDRKDRRQTYAEMLAMMLEPVRQGRRVCAVLYGHPGVFARAPHLAVQQARAEGFDAFMEPGISAEACLYADLGIDPGQHGVCSFEATQFLVYAKQADPSAYLLLWQLALTGNLNCIGFDAAPERLALLREKLCRWYAPGTKLILYEAAWLPITPFRAERIALAELPEATLREYTTLVIPPVRAALHDKVWLQRLARIDADSCSS